MIVGIDACTWTNRRGYGRFTRGLVSALVTEFPHHEYRLVVDRQTAEEGTFPAGASLTVVDTTAPPARAAAADGSRSPADLWRMGRAASRMQADVFLFPTNYSFFPLWSSTPVVTVFHDATAEHHPELIFPTLVPRTLWRLKSRIARWQSDRIVTVSSDAQRQIAEAFHYAPESMPIVSEGTDPVFRPLAASDESAAALYAVRDRYALPHDRALVLYVGGISPHKNLAALLRAHALANRLHTPRHLVLVGDYVYDNFLSSHRELVTLVAELGLGDRVTFTGFVPDAELALLYNAATAFVLPSMSEGFGLPVLEAMASGLPVAVSNRTSLPEVIGDAGVLFDPTSPEDIARAIDRLLTDAPLRRSLRERGLARAARYSWRMGAGAMAQILEEVAERRATRVQAVAR